MAFDFSGTFNRVHNWQSDAAASIKITAIRHDEEDDGFATGLSNCITKDGKTQPTADIPMAGKKIINHGATVAEDPASTVATKGYVDNFKSFGTGITVGGAGPINGFINFTAPSGVNGIGWTTADMSWIGRKEEAGKWNKRLAVNDAKDGTGTDVFAIDEAGRVNSFGRFANNLVWDGTASRAPVAGISTQMTIEGGTFILQSNDTATAGPYLTPTLRPFFTAQNASTGTYIYIDKEKSGETCRITGRTGVAARWIMDLGNATAETGGTTGRGGSDFVLYSCANDGSGADAEITINRSTHAIALGGTVTTASNITALGSTITASGGYFQGAAALAVLACATAGTVYLRPNGVADAAGEVRVGATGDLSVPEGSVFVAGGAATGGNGITLSELGYGDFARAGTGAGSGFTRFMNSNGIIGSIASASATSVAYATTSDERLKDVKGDYVADAAIAIIRADPVKSFTWKASGEEAVGWLAQRSYAVDKSLAVPPEMAADGRQVDENDRWGVDYGARTPYLWAALAAALDKIDVLTARIEALEAAP